MRHYLLKSATATLVFVTLIGLSSAFAGGAVKLVPQGDGDTMVIDSTMNPYIITEQLSIERGSRLEIHEGSEILVAPGVEMMILGELWVEGTSRHPVTISGMDGEFWGGILIDGEGGDGGYLRHTYLYGTRAGIQVDHADFSIEESAIFASHSCLTLDNFASVTLSESLLDLNTFFEASSVLLARQSELSVTHSRIEYNLQAGTQVLRPQPVRLFQTGGEISQTEIFVEGPGPVLAVDLVNSNNLLFQRNTIRLRGGNGLSGSGNLGIRIAGCEIDIEHVNVDLDNSELPASGLYITDASDVNLINSVVSSQAYYGEPESIQMDLYSLPSTAIVHYSVLHNVVQRSAEGLDFDSPTILETDPLWIDPGKGDYHLDPNSPCIDAGAPFSPPDSDGSIADIGRHPFLTQHAGLRPEPALPEGLKIGAIWPNPFNSKLRYEVHLSEAATLRVELFSITGRRVATLLAEPRMAGQHRLVFDASQLSSSLASGVYLLRVRAAQQLASRRIVYLR